MWLVINVLALWCRNLATPKLIEALSGKQVVCIAAGTGYSAAVAGGGALYTWGRGSLGRLGHGEQLLPLTVRCCCDVLCVCVLLGNTDDVTSPKAVEGLKDVKIVDIDCGQEDGHSLAVDSEGGSPGDRCGRVSCVYDQCVYDQCVCSSVCALVCVL